MSKETESNQMVDQNNQSSSKDLTKDSTKNANTGNPSRNGLILELRWSTRNLLINHLNQLSAVVHKKAITNQIQSLLVRDNDHLLLILANLPLKPTTEVTGDELEYVEDPISNELFLDIEAVFRIEIIQSLITNKSYAVSYHGSVASQTKADLVKANNKIINRLLELPVKIKNHLVVSDMSEYFYRKGL